MKRDYPLLKNRNDEHEIARAQLEEEVSNLKKENYTLNEKYNLQTKRYQSIDTELKSIRDDYL